MFQKRLDELEKERDIYKDNPDKLDRISKEEYAYQQEIRMLKEKQEQPKENKKRKRR